MDAVTKSVEAQVRPVDSDSPNGEFEVILSTERLDRDGENLWIDEWKQPLPARIHIDSDHGMSVEKTVGSAVPCIEGNQMIGRGTYAGTPHAQMVRQLVKDEHITSLSVTYSERKNRKDGKPQRELLNAAFVAVPANPDAVVRSSKQFDDASGDHPDTGDEHSGHAQRIHDAAVQLGAQCTNPAEADTGEADGANKAADDAATKHKTSGPPAGSPQKESAEESAAADTAADQATVSAAAEESAETAAKQAAGVRARSLAFLTNRHTEQD